MPPKVDLKTLTAKRDNAMRFLYELFEEFQVVINVQPELELIEKIYKEIESKYRGFKKQIEVIEDRTIENQAPVTRYRIRIGAISILGVFQSCLLLKLFIFDVFV